MKAYPMWYNPQPLERKGLAKNAVIISTELTARIKVTEPDERPKNWIVIKRKQVGNSVIFTKMSKRYLTKNLAERAAFELSICSNKPSNVSYSVGKVA